MNIQFYEDLKLIRRILEAKLVDNTDSLVYKVSLLSTDNTDKYLIRIESDYYCPTIKHLSVDIPVSFNEDSFITIIEDYDCTIDKKHFPYSCLSSTVLAERAMAYCTIEEMLDTFHYCPHSFDEVEEF